MPGTRPQQRTSLGLRRAEPCWRRPGYGSGPGQGSRSGSPPLRLRFAGGSASGSIRGGARGATRAQASASPSGWVESWVDGEVSRRPVVLFADGLGAESQAMRRVLEEALVHYELVDVGAMGQAAPPESPGGGGPSWSELVAERLAYLSGGEDLPLLFVGGRPVGGRAAGAARLAAAGELQERCARAGAARREPERPAARLPWTPRENLRWRPPKDINGRRWYQDAPNSASRPDEHADAARIEYNIDSVVPGAGTDQYGRFTGSAKALLRWETGLPDPDPHGTAPFSDVNLLLDPDYSYSEYLRSRDLGRALNVTAEDVKREGLSKDQLVWVYSQGKKKLVDELTLRQCRGRVLTTLDVRDLREALMDEMRKERAFSPTGLGVVPGVVQSLSGPEFRAERYADTEVPLLLAITSEGSPACFHLRDRLQAAVKRALRAVRVVRVDGRRYPEVPRAFGVSRYPTLVWLAARSGEELAREVGVVSASAIFERTRAVLGLRELPPPREGARLLDRPRWSTRGHFLVEDQLAPRWQSRRAIRNSV